MALRMRVQAGIDRVRPVVEAALADARWEICPSTEAGAQPIRLQPLDEGLRIEWDAVTRTTADRLVQRLAEHGIGVMVVSCTIPLGSRGEVVEAHAWRIDENGASDLDVQADAEEILSDWTQEGPLYEEGEAELELCNELLAGEAKGRAAVLHVRRTLSPKLASLVEAIAAGASMEWAELQGRPAVRLNAEDGTRITLVTPDEREQLERALREHGG